jgi:hypothetical protein
MDVHSYGLTTGSDLTATHGEILSLAGLWVLTVVDRGNAHSAVSSVLLRLRGLS